MRNKDSLGAYKVAYLGYLKADNGIINDEFKTAFAAMMKARESALENGVSESRLQSAAETIFAKYTAAA